MSWRELWKLQGRAKKFWKVRLAGKSLTEQFGTVGSAGEMKATDFPSSEAAKDAYEKLIRKKQVQGWFDKPDPNDTRMNLFLAAETGNVTEVRKCLGQDPQAVHSRFEGVAEQPLHRAVRNGHAKVARLLLDAGADINARGEDGQVPFLYACHEGEPDFDMLAVLLEYHPDLNITDDVGITPLYLVTAQKELADLLHEHGVALESDQVLDLMSALETKGMKYVEKLIEANPALARSPHIGQFAKDILSARSVRLIKLLLENGLDATFTSHDVSLLQQAIFRDSPEIVRALLEHGADPNGKGGDGQPLLIECWRFGFKNRKAICDLLVQHGARKDLAAVLYMDGVKAVIATIERDPKTLASVADPLDLLNRAIEKGSLELVELLLRNGVDPNAHGRTKEAPLRRAVRFGSFRIVQSLLEHGADPNPEDVATVEQGAGLCYAAEYRVLNFKGGTKLQDLLLAHGMKPMPTRS